MRARLALVTLASLAACAVENPPSKMSPSDRRHEMVAQQLAARGITDPRVLAAMSDVPREAFVPEELRSLAYDDRPLPIGFEQTISQPYIVAFMTQALALDGHEKVLEIGTGSGYQAAVLAQCAREVYSIEIVEPLGLRARATLDSLGLGNVHTRVGDGFRGWPESAPFDAILVAAAPEQVPQPLIDQLAIGGKLVIPVGSAEQELLLIERTPSGITRRSILPVRFVPMTGEAQRR
jgi:protein-L-isoaspartate(D-aspartate) O-methyltransferase